MKTSKILAERDEFTKRTLFALTTEAAELAAQNDRLQDRIRVLAERHGVPYPAPVVG